MADDINPRQFSSLESSGLLSSSLANRPPTGTPSPINNGFIQSLEAEYYRQQGKGQSVLQESPTQYVQRLQAEQIQRNELANRIPTTDKPELAPPSSNNLLNQPPPSTPERQPPPSTGSPPPTPNGTAARASPLVEPTATPAPAALAEAIRPGGNPFASLPRSLPEAAGRFAVPGAFAAADFGIRVYQGQPVTQAASGAVAGAVGAFGGAALGAAFAGPVGAVVGGMVGGYVGGAISDSFFHSSPSTGSPPAEVPNYSPFIGGQVPGGVYTVSATWDIYYPDGRYFSQVSGGDSQIYGPITGIYLENTADSAPGLRIAANDRNGNSKISKQGNGDVSNTVVKNLRDIKVTKNFSLYDGPINLSSPAPPPDNLPYRYDASPIGNDNTVSSGVPASGANKGKARNVAPSLPSNNTPNGAPFFPGHGGLAPSYLPNPTQTPSNLGGMLPSTAPAPAPPPFAEPKDAPAPRISPAPGGSASPSADPGIPASPDPRVSRISNGVVTDPPIDIAQPIPIGSSLTTIPSSSNKTSRANPTPDGVSPVPKAQTSPSPKTPEQTATNQTNQTIQQQNKDFTDQVARLTTMAAVLAGLTPIIQGIPDAIANSPVVQAANKATTQGAVCEIAKPGGCLGDALDNNADKINKNNNQNTASLLDKINAGANAAQLALLELINTKLGEQLVGGISGFLKTFFDGFNKLTEWLHLDRALNILTFVMTVQNVYFLCDSMKVVTLQMISDMLAVVGIKDKDNNPLNLNEILGHEVESLLKSILGEQELSGFKKEWKALNRIYQAATNTLFAIQNMVFSVLQALEIIGSWNASIGNALKKYLVVGQKAFEWMNPNPNFHNNFFKFMGNALNVVTSLDFVAQSILQGRQAIDDFGKQTDELSKGIADASDGFKPPENKATAEAAAKSASSSKSPIPSPEDVKTIQD